MTGWTDTPPPTAFGRLLRAAIDAYRPKLHSARAAALLIGISPTQVSSYLRGETQPNPRTARKIAEKLHMDLAEVRQALPDPTQPPAPRVVDKDQFAREVADLVVQRLSPEVAARGRLEPDDPLLQEKNLLFDAISGVSSPEGLEAVRRVLAEFRANGRDDEDDR